MTSLRDLDQSALPVHAAMLGRLRKQPSDGIGNSDAKAPALSNFRVLVVPGLHNSGPGHWQTRWEESHPSFERVEQRHWDQPDLHAWSAQVGHALRRSARPAILVAPASPHKFGINADLTVAPHGIPTIVVGSEDDPWLTLDGARFWAGQWGSAFVNAGPLGHINADSGLDDWPFGLALLERLAALVPAKPLRRCGVSCGAAPDSAV